MKDRKGNPCTSRMRLPAWACWLHPLPICFSQVSVSRKPTTFHHEIDYIGRLATLAFSLRQHLYSNNTFGGSSFLD